MILRGGRAYTAAVADAERLILIDGHSLIYRSFFAFQGSRNQGAVEFTVRRTGEIVTAVYGFTSAFLSILDDLKPDARGDRARRAGEDVPAREGRDVQGDARARCRTSCGGRRGASAR